MSRDEVRRFLETAPLYSKLEIPFAQPIQRDEFPFAASLTLACTSCKKDTTWAWEQNWQRDISLGTCLSYYCGLCREARACFVLKIDPSGQEKKSSVPALAARIPDRFSMFKLTKIGQFPPYSINPPREIVEALGEHGTDLYKRALLLMSQGYGLGAVAYFRRLIEDAAVLLLDVVQEAADAESDDEARNAVAMARSSHNVDEKLRLVKDHVPAAIRPHGINPFAVLYGHFSSHLHGEPDDACLNIALELRTAFDFIFKTSRQTLKEARAFRETIQAKAGAKKRP